jgi:hypothetical protein
MCLPVHLKVLLHKIEHFFFNKVRFQVVMMVRTKMTVIWDAAPCSMIKFTGVSEVLAASITRALREC